MPEYLFDNHCLLRFITFLNKMHLYHGIVLLLLLRSQWFVSSYLHSSNGRSCKLTAKPHKPFSLSSYESRYLTIRSSNTDDLLGGKIAIGNWYDLNDCQVLFPDPDKYYIPKGIIHFIGGYLAGSFVSLTYGGLLNYLSQQGYLVVASIYPPLDTNHSAVALDISSKFRSCYNLSLRPLYKKSIDDIPIIGLSHSLGGKLMALMFSRKEDRKLLPPRLANVYLAFNNFGADESYDFTVKQSNDLISRYFPELYSIIKGFSKASRDFGLDNFSRYLPGNSKSRVADDLSFVTNAMAEFGDLFKAPFQRVQDIAASQRIDVDFKGTGISDLASLLLSISRDAATRASIPGNAEFSPSPRETWQALVSGYNVQQNFLIKFTDDDIDQSVDLSHWLKVRGCDSRTISLRGNHVTPISIVHDKASHREFYTTLSRLMHSIVFSEASSPAQLPIMSSMDWDTDDF